MRSSTPRLDEIQLRSKHWLLDELEPVAPLTDATMIVLGGWCGVLPWLLYRRRGWVPQLTVSVDVDPVACSIGARTTGRETPRLHFLCQDVHRLDYDRLATGHRLVLVNTICEHLSDFAGWRRLVPPGTRVVLQSNDYRGCPDHVNCVDSASSSPPTPRCDRLTSSDHSRCHCSPDTWSSARPDHRIRPSGPSDDRT